MKFEFNNETEFENKTVINNNNESCVMPIYECPQTRVCERYIVHDVPHVIPMHTRIVNHHIYKHTYTPVFTSDECDTVENVYGDSCNMK